MFNLYQIDEAIRSVISMADENGEINAEAFEQLQMAKAEKQLNVIKWIKHLKDLDGILKREEKRIQKLKKANKNQLEFMRKYLKGSMDADHMLKIDFDLHKATISDSADKLIITNEEELKKRFGKVEIKVDEAAAKKFLKTGKKLDCAYLEPRTKITIY